MSSQKPKALQLAESLRPDMHDDALALWTNEAAVELRCLHAANLYLVSELRIMRDHIAELEKKLADYLLESKRADKAERALSNAGWTLKEGAQE